MTDKVFAAAAMAVVGVGVVLCAIHLLATAVAVAIHRPRPEFVSWGYVGGGMALAIAGFLVGDGIANGGRRLDDLPGLIIVFVAGNWGFGAAQAWAGQFGLSPHRRQMSFVMASLALGLMVGLGSAPLGI